MPTNNQEKWEKEYEKLFGDFIGSALWYTPVREFIRQAIRQEILQAKIEGLKLAQKIMVEGKEEFKGVDDEIYEYINQEISNLTNAAKVLGE